MRRTVAISLAGCLVVLLVAPLGAQTGSEEAYTFYSVMALADGVTAEFEIDALLPVDQLVGLSSVTAEAHLGLGRADALAALPDPGDLVLTLPGTLSGLTGVTGLPDYPAAARAEHPAIPEDEVTFAPDGGVGAGRLRAVASEEGSSASAAVAHLVDTVGLLPGFSIGSVRTTATTERLGGGGFRSTATTTLGDVRLLGGLLRIDQVTTEVQSEVSGGRSDADASHIDLAGVTLAGTPVAIGEQGLEGLGQATALAPVVDQLTEPLRDAGVSVHTTPASVTEEDGRAVATGGTLVIEAPLEVQGRPGTFVLTVGRATASTEAGGGAPAPTDVGTSGPIVPTGDGAGSGATGTIAPSGASLIPSGSTGSASPTSPSTGTGGVTGPVVAAAGREVPGWQVIALYRGVALGALALFGARHVVRRLAGTGARRTDLRPLWRW